MARTVRQSVAPAYLLLCLLLGGSAQGIWTIAVLQVVGLAIIAWAAIERPAQRPSLSERYLFALLAAALIVIALQMVPLPDSLWSSFGPRGKIASEIELLGDGLGAMPLSLTPYQGLDMAMRLIPPLAIFLAIARLHAARISFLVLALVTGTVAGVMLGVFQVSARGPAQSAFYFYPYSNVGVATGFFANANHMAALLLACIPFLAALVASARDGAHVRFRSVAMAAAALLLVLFVGLALNRSLAGLLLLVPVVGASALIILKVRTRARRRAIVPIAFLALVGLTLVMAHSIAGGVAEDRGRGAEDSRVAIAQTTARATIDYMPLGSGLGSFSEVYQTYEDPASVPQTTVVHAHDDYLELALELGLPGIVILVLFLGWWGRMTWLSWRSPDLFPYVRAATIVSFALLVHSLVDFPLRTSALSAVFAMCLAIIAEPHRRDPLDPSNLRPTRHVSIS